MSRLNHTMRRRAIAGLLVVAGSMAVAVTVRVASAPAGPAAHPSQATLSVDMPVITPHNGAVDPLTCLLFKYDLGPLGPLGPWGPMGPLHDRPHPACVGGGPAYK